MKFHILFAALCCAAAGAEVCEKDFSKCPDGWNKSGSICYAPEKFVGCSRRFNVNLMNTPMKKAFAKNCAVQFPCKENSFLKDPQSVLNVHVLDEGSSFLARKSVGDLQREAGSVGYLTGQIRTSADPNVRLGKFQDRPISKANESKKKY